MPEEYQPYKTGDEWKAACAKTGLTHYELFYIYNKFCQGLDAKFAAFLKWVETGPTKEAINKVCTYRKFSYPMTPENFRYWFDRDHGILKQTGLFDKVLEEADKLWSVGRAGWHVRACGLGYYTMKTGPLNLEPFSGTRMLESSYPLKTDIESFKAKNVLSYQTKSQWEWNGYNRESNEKLLDPYKGMMNARSSGVAWKEAVELGAQCLGHMILPDIAYYRKGKTLPLQAIGELKTGIDVKQQSGAGGDTENLTFAELAVQGIAEVYLTLITDYNVKVGMEIDYISQVAYPESIGEKGEDESDRVRANESNIGYIPEIYATSIGITGEEYNKAYIDSMKETIKDLIESETPGRKECKENTAPSVVISELRDLIDGGDEMQGYADIVPGVTKYNGPIEKVDANLCPLDTNNFQKITMDIKEHIEKGFKDYKNSDDSGGEADKKFAHHRILSEFDNKQLNDFEGPQLRPWNISDFSKPLPEQEESKAYAKWLKYKEPPSRKPPWSK